jgi:hypothetical protein
MASVKSGPDRSSDGCGFPGRAGLGLLGLCAALAACAPGTRIPDTSPDGPRISELRFVPDHTSVGCPTALRFHLESPEGRPASGVTSWVLMQGLAASDAPGDALRLARSGPLGGEASGELTVPVTFPSWGAYRYYVQVQDEAGRWSNVLGADVVVSPRARHVLSICP